METRDDRGRGIYHGIILVARNECGPDNGVRGRDASRTSIRHNCNGDRRTTPEAVFPRLLSNVVFYPIVDRDLPLRDRPNMPWSEWGVSRHLPVYRTATLLRSEILDG
jgi:hypothetical protein